MAVEPLAPEAPGPIFREWVFALCRTEPAAVSRVLLELAKDLPRWGPRIRNCLRESTARQQRWALEHYQRSASTPTGQSAYAGALAALELGAPAEARRPRELDEVLWVRSTPGAEPVTVRQNTADYAAAAFIRVWQAKPRAPSLDEINRKLVAAAEAARASVPKEPPK